jgi:hypothetical protein
MVSAVFVSSVYGVFEFLHLVLAGRIQKHNRKFSRKDVQLAKTKEKV